MTIDYETTSPRSSRPAFLVAALAFAAFVSLGLPDGVLGVAWPSVHTAFGLPISRLGVLLTAGVCGSLLSSFFAGQIVRAIGVGKLLLASSIVVVAGLTCIGLAPVWHLVVVGAFLGGLGGGAIDAGINAFAAERFSPRIVTWLHACYGVGATLGPLLMTACLYSAGGWRLGYGVIAGTLAAMAVMFAFTLPLWQTPHARGGHDAAAEPLVPATAAEAVRRPVVWGQAALFLVYTGTEVTAGQWLYSLMTESRGWSTAPAGTLVGGFWLALTAGRVVFGQLATRHSVDAILRFATLLAPVAAAMIWRPVLPFIDAAGAMLLGFLLAPIYPLLMSATPDRVGRRFAAQSIGFQVSAATVGVALLPGVAGVIARRNGLEAVPAYLLVTTLALLALQEGTRRLAARERGGPPAGDAATRSPEWATPSGEPR